MMDKMIKINGINYSCPEDWSEEKLSSRIMYVEGLKELYGSKWMAYDEGTSIKFTPAEQPSAYKFALDLIGKQGEYIEELRAEVAELKEIVDFMHKWVAATKK